MTQRQSRDGASSTFNHATKHLQRCQPRTPASEHEDTRCRSSRSEACPCYSGARNHHPHSTWLALRLESLEMEARSTWKWLHVTPEQGQRSRAALPNKCGSRKSALNMSCSIGSLNSFLGHDNPVHALEGVPDVNCIRRSFIHSRGLWQQGVSRLLDVFDGR